MDSKELRRLLHGYQTARILSACAEFNLADHLREGPLTVEVLAEREGVVPELLRRLIRAAIVLGVFGEDEQGLIHSTPLSELLRADHPENLKAVAICFAQPWVWSAWGELSNCIRTGKTGTELLYQRTFFEYLAGNPAAHHIFNQIMAGGGDLNEQIAAACDLTSVRVVLDIGGGSGSLLCSLLRHAPAARGVILDLPALAPEASAAIAAAGLEDRAVFQGGDFFEHIPTGADLMVLRYILHDWPDEQGELILRNARASLPPDGQLLVVESLLAAGREVSPRSRFLDIGMVVTTGGRERTLAEYQVMLERTGFVLEQAMTVHPIYQMTIMRARAVRGA